MDCCLCSFLIISIGRVSSLMMSGFNTKLSTRMIYLAVTCVKGSKKRPLWYSLAFGWLVCLAVRKLGSRHSAIQQSTILTASFGLGCSGKHPVVFPSYQRRHSSPLWHSVILGLSLGKANSLDLIFNSCRGLIFSAFAELLGLHNFWPADLNTPHQSW